MIEYTLSVEPYRNKIMDYYYSDLVPKYGDSGIWVWLEEEFGARRHYEPWYNGEGNPGHHFKFKTEAEMTFFILRWA